MNEIQEYAVNSGKVKIVWCALSASQVIRRTYFHAINVIEQRILISWKINSY